MLSSLKEDVFSLRGGAAGVIVLSAFVSIIAIATTGWTAQHYDKRDDRYRNEDGLWETCECRTRDSDRKFIVIAPCF